MKIALQKFKTKKDVAEMFQVSTRTVERWVDSGELKGIVTGGGKNTKGERSTVVFADEQILSFAESRRMKASVLDYLTSHPNGFEALIASYDLTELTEIPSGSGSSRTLSDDEIKALDPETIVEVPVHNGCGVNSGIGWIDKRLGDLPLYRQLVPDATPKPHQNDIDTTVMDWIDEAKGKTR